MNRRYHALLLLGWLATIPIGHADPIHAVGGGFWHHDTGWVFPSKVLEFELVGIPQDVAGSDEAVAYYARVVDGTRITVSISVCPVASALADPVASAGEPKRLISEGTLSSDTPGIPSASRSIYEVAEKRAVVGEYSLTTPEMRAAIRFAEAPANAEPMMDAFVRSLRWETFTSAPTPR